MNEMEQAVKCCLINRSCTGCPRQAKEYPTGREDCRDLLFDHISLALLEQAERENPKPLTLDELRQMDGEPVWVKIIDASVFADEKDVFDGYGLLRKSWVRLWDGKRADLINVAHHFENYGKTWLAYRRKPKEDT